MPETRLGHFVIERRLALGHLLVAVGTAQAFKPAAGDHAGEGIEAGEAEALVGTKRAVDKADSADFFHREKCGSVIDASLQGSLIVDYAVFGAVEKDGFDVLGGEVGVGGKHLGHHAADHWSSHIGAGELEDITLRLGFLEARCGNLHRFCTEVGV